MERLHLVEGGKDDGKDKDDDIVKCIPRLQVSTRLLNGLHYMVTDDR